MPDRKSDNESILARWFRGISLRAKGVAGLSVPMTALFIAMLSIYWFEGNAPDADKSVMRAYDTRAEILQFQVFLLDAETAVSGYLATGDIRRLASYESARKSTQRSLARLTSFVGGDTASADTLEQIRISAEEEMDTLGQSAARHRSPGGPQPSAGPGQGADCGGAVAPLHLESGQDLRLFARAMTAMLLASSCFASWWCAEFWDRSGRCSFTWCWRAGWCAVFAWWKRMRAGWRTDYHLSRSTRERRNCRAGATNRRRRLPVAGS